MNSNTVTPRCKVGDWALVVKPLYPENAGRVVRIVRPADPSEYWDGGDETVWLVRSEGCPLRECDENMKTTLAQETVMRDMRLLPIWWKTTHDVETAALIGGIRDRSRVGLAT